MLDCEDWQLLFITLNREDFSFVIHLDRQPRTSRRREAQTGSRARSGSRSERTLDAVEHSRTLMEWWPFLIFHRGGLRIKVINNSNTGVLLPHAGAAKHYKEVIELPDEITLKHKDLIGWRPAKFGQHFSFEMPLYKESEHVDKDLFGIELTMPVGEYERQTVVVNQQGLICTFLPIGPTP